MVETADSESKSSSSMVTVSGQIFGVTGYYRYTGHVNGTDECFVPPQANRMIFDEGEKAPLLGGCPHKVKWQFMGSYKEY